MTKVTRPSRPPAPAATRQRILEAAARVFAQEGLAGATTRGIAVEAQVNEVTLFRHFHSKDRLIEAVVGETFAQSMPTEAPAAVRWSGDLETDLLAHGRRYAKALETNMPLIRTMIGELHHRQPEAEDSVFKRIFKVLRESLRERLEQAIADGTLSREAHAEMLTDLFHSMLFTALLRRSLGKSRPSYSAARYLRGAVSLFLRGAAVEA